MMQKQEATSTFCSDYSEETQIYVIGIKRITCRHVSVCHLSHGEMKL